MRDSRRGRRPPAVWLLAAVPLVMGTVACYRTRPEMDGTAEQTVLMVDNQGFDDMNIFVIPEASSRIRLGSATGKSRRYFTLPSYLTRHVQSMRFQALPIATPRGPVSEELTVAPGDTVVLFLPPG